MRQRHDEEEHPLMTLTKRLVPAVIWMTGMWMVSMVIMMWAWCREVRPMERDVCGTCQKRNKCPERSRMYQCSTYKKRTPAAATAKDPERNKN